MTAPVVAITGAGGGIGSALAHEFGGRGYRLALADIAPVDALQRDLEAAGVECFSAVVDVRDRADLGAWAAEIDARFGQLDVLINNAGVTTWGALADQDPADVDWVLDVNVRGVTHGCHVFVPLLRRAARGHIVNIASMVGRFAMPMQTTYTASKWAVRGFTRALRIELRSEGIGVTAVLPGVISTGFLAAARNYDGEQQAQLAALMKRFGSSPALVARRIARAVRWNRGEIRVGWDSHLVAFLQRFLPGLLPLALRLIYPRLLAARTDQTESS